MQKALLAASIVLALMSQLFGVTPKTALADSPIGTVSVPGLGDLQVSEPRAHKNLTLFVLYKSIHPAKEIDYLTLDEAVEAKLVEITEAPNEQVRQLLISYSGEKPLFLIAGELVKGGKQDRTLETSLVIPPHTQKAVLPSFCVERSRWSGGKGFKSANNLAPNAAQQALSSGAQGEVWGSVQGYKDKLRHNSAQVAGKAVVASRTSSLNEELNDADVQKMLGEYEKAMVGISDELSCPVGLAYVVDGKVTAMNVFDSSLLFKKLEEKLIRSAAIDAAVGQIDKKPTPVGFKDLQKFVATAGEGKKMTQELGMDNLFIRYVNDKTFSSQLIHKGFTVHSQIGRFDKKFSRGNAPNIQQQGLLPQMNQDGNQPMEPQQRAVPQQQLRR